MNKNVTVEITKVERGEPISCTQLAEDGYELQEDLSTVSSDDTDRLLITIAIPENDPVELCVEGSIKIFLEDDASSSNPLTSLPRRSTSTASSGYPNAKAMQKRPSQGSITSPDPLPVPQAGAATPKQTPAKAQSPAQSPSSSSSGSPAKSGARASIAKGKSLARQLTQDATQSGRASVKPAAKSKAEGSTPQATALTPITEGNSGAQPAAKAAAPKRTNTKGAASATPKAASAKASQASAAAAPEEVIHHLLKADTTAYKGKTILEKDALAKMLAGNMPLAETQSKIIPFFGHDKPEKDNGCRFLSNFYDKEGMTPITLTFEGKTYTFPSVEVQYQCRKSLLSRSEAGKAANQAEVIEAFVACTDAKSSKKLANDKYFSFDARNLDQMDTIMFEGLLQKFPNDPTNPMTQKLLRTGNSILIEGNEWGDTNWGMVYDAENQTFEGDNKLGKMLMLIRHARSQGQTDSDIDRSAWQKQTMDNLLTGRLFKSAAKSPQVTLPQEAFAVGIPYKLMTPSSKDVAWVQSLYTGTAIDSQQISKVEKIRSRAMYKGYDSKLSLLDRRKGNWIFDPKWKADALDKAIANCVSEIAAKQQASEQEGITADEKAKLEKDIKKLKQQKEALEKKLEEVPLREAVHNRLMDLVTDSRLTEDLTGVKEVWLWHGTSKAAADGVMKSGFASLASRDEGFYGKGLYFSSNLGSIQKAYTPEVLLLSKVCFYSAYPVAKSWDLQDLYNKNNHDNHDIHYVPTVRKPLPKEVYDALKSSPGAYRSIPDDPTKARNYPIDEAAAIPIADEFVVFDPSQILLSYRIETEPGAKSSKQFYEVIATKEEKAKTQEDKLTAGLKVATITQQKLDDPNKVLTVDESHSCTQKLPRDG